jgi:hypothetical protein
MVNISRGMRVQSTYEQVAAQVELDQFSKVKLPFRASKFILESPSVLAIDGANEAEIEAFEKRKRVQAARQAEISKVAQERGVSRALLEQHTHQPVTPQIEVESDDFESRRFAASLREPSLAYHAATTRATNVSQFADQVRMSLAEANRSQPHVRIADDPEYFDMTPTTTPPNEPDFDLAIPSVPRRLAGGALSAASGTVRVVSELTPTVDTLLEAARLTQRYGPAVARRTMAAAGYSAAALAAVARGVGRGGAAALPAAGVSASALAVVARGLGRGGHSAGNAAGNALVAASNLLGSTGQVASHRGRDFAIANGIQRVARVVMNHGVLARHALT